MKIDAHQFFWKYEKGIFNNKGISNVDVLKNDFLPHDSLVDLVNNDISGCIAIQNYKSDDETHALLDLSNDYDFIQGVVGWIDLENPKIGQKINYYKDKKVVAFRDNFNDIEDAFYPLKKEVIRGLELIHEYKIPFEFRSSIQQFPSILDLMYLREGQTFILNDMGFLPPSRNSWHSWEIMLRAASQNPNVYCKINGVFKLRVKFGYSDEDLKHLLLTLYDVFGADRLIFGSDWPYLKLNGSYQELIAFIKECYKDLKSTDLDLIFGENAEKIYLDSRKKKAN
ncbi:amidohydrolase family protein [Membranihabitans maritimus]|uniref:amidohydrolase family protein n=1 Tax=Membranihabitans maritimus TaxID=2904244 RepID=UPI001F48877C|nr:amidohydrolase family protein [Membranihabitans maritimus]